MGTAIFPFSNNLDRIVRHAELTGQPVMLVKDQGIYLMCRGLKAQASDNALCAYALGCDPSDKSGDDGIGWYDRARAIAGGDDFAEELRAKELAPLIRQGLGLKFQLSETHLTITAA